MANIADTIRKLFPRDLAEFFPVKVNWWQKIDFNNLKTKEGFWISLAVLVIILPGVYYYNKLIDLSRYTEMEDHQIDVQLQRRKDLSRNLVKTVIDYAEHERSMFKYAIDKNAGGAGAMAAGSASLAPENLAELAKMDAAGISKSAMNKMLALAEAYPDLKLSGNFQILMQGLIRTEDNIALRRMAYNEAASNFHAYVRRVPACFYAFIFGYREKMFHYAEVDKDVGQYIKIAY